MLLAKQAVQWLPYKEILEWKYHVSAACDGLIFIICCHSYWQFMESSLFLTNYLLLLLIFSWRNFNVWDLEAIFSFTSLWFVQKMRSASCVISFHFGLAIIFFFLVAVFKLSSFQILGISGYLVLPVCCAHWGQIELLFCMLNREKYVPTLFCTSCMCKRSCPLAELSSCAFQWLCCSPSEFILNTLTDVRAHSCHGLDQCLPFLSPCAFVR